MPAKVLGNNPWLELNGQYIMAFDWIDGRVLRYEECTTEHCRSIGRVLSKLHHLDTDMVDVDAAAVLTVPENVWRGLVDRARQSLSCWGLPCESLLQDVMRWSHLYENAVGQLSHRQVFSHRDLDFKNVIWSDRNVPYLIDWESAGYVNPSEELMEVATSWSRGSQGTLNRHQFQAVIGGYLETGGTVDGPVLNAVYASLGSALGWLAYNMRRSLDEDTFAADEQALGFNEVVRTVEQLRNFDEIGGDCAHWAEEVLNRH